MALFVRQSSHRQLTAGYWVLALFCRGLLHVQFTINPFPQETCPSSPPAENWVCLAQFALWRLACCTYFRAPPPNWLCLYSSLSTDYRLPTAAFWLRLARVTQDWNVGTMEYWNDGTSCPAEIGFVLHVWLSLGTPIAGSAAAGIGFVLRNRSPDPTGLRRIGFVLHFKLQTSHFQLLPDWLRFVRILATETSRARSQRQPISCDELGIVSFMWGALW